jgi:hypothetical protein
VIKKIEFSELLNLLICNQNIISEITCNGVWFSEKKYGISWKFKQITIIQNTTNYDNKYTNIIF